MEGSPMIRRFLAPLILLSAASPLWGQITVTPPESDAHDPIVAVLANPIPEGAQVQGGWQASTVKTLPAPEGIHIWAKPGTHTVSYRGVWIATVPVTLADGTVVQVLQGFGFLDESATFTVKGGTGPNPPLPPDPGGKWQMMLFYEADRLDNYPEPQRQLLTSRVVREQLTSDGHRFRKVVESAALSGTASAEFEPWFKAVRGKTLPRVAIAPVEGGAVREFPLPADLTALKQLLDGGANADVQH
jgi:hypothetical protein